MRRRTGPSSGQSRARTAFGVARVVVAIVGIVALVGDYQYILGFSSFSKANYFAYFTNQSNAAGVVVMCLGAWLSFRRPVDPGWLMTARMLTATFTIISGIVFGLIAVESSNRGVRVDVPWSSALLHFVIPTLALLDWLLGPGRRPVAWRGALTVLGFPIVWGVITLVRGALIGWYPYFFLDPAQVDGPVMFVVYDVIVLGLIAGIAAFMLALSRVRPLGAARATEWRGPLARLRERLSRQRRRTGCTARRAARHRSA